MVSEDLWVMMKCLFAAAALDVVAVVLLFGGWLFDSSAVMVAATTVLWVGTLFVLYGAFVPAIRRAQGRRMGGE